MLLIFLAIRIKFITLLSYAAKILQILKTIFHSVISCHCLYDFDRMINVMSQKLFKPVYFEV